MEEYIDEIKSLKKIVAEHEASVNSNLEEIEKLSHDLIDREEKIQNLESDIEIKSGDIKTLNEEFISKYKMIEELQCEIDCLTQTCPVGNEREKELKMNII